MQSSGWLEIGKIVSAQGLNGELRVYPNTDFPERFEQPGKRWLLRPHAQEPEPVELLSGRYLNGKGLYVIRLAGIRDRTQAEAMRDCRLLVPEDDRPPLEEGEFHVMDLIGLEVFDQATQMLVGTVVDVISAGNDLLEIKRAAPEATQETQDQQIQDQQIQDQQIQDQQIQKPVAQGQAATVLIPFVEAIVPVVDLVQRRIEITPPPGLIN